MRNNFITTTQISDIMNIEADAESRSSEIRSEWKLNESYIQSILNHLKISPSVDLLASRINTQLTRFFSYRPDPNAEVIKTSTVNWRTIDFCCFSPVCFIGKVIQKIISDKTSVILSVPKLVLVCIFNRLACRTSVFHSTYAT